MNNVRRLLMAETKGKLVINNLHNITLKVEVSNVLTLRLQMFQRLMRLACWVGSVGVEFVDFEPPNTACTGQVGTRPENSDPDGL